MDTPRGKFSEFFLFIMCARAHYAHTCTYIAHSLHIMCAQNVCTDVHGQTDAARLLSSLTIAIIIT